MTAKGNLGIDKRVVETALNHFSGTKRPKLCLMPN
jgi:hypothetical protein